MRRQNDSGRQDDSWQRCCGHWQDRFIRENFLSLGCAGWRGFMTQGRGMVVCEVAIDVATDVVTVGINPVDWSLDVVPYATQFLPEMEILAYLSGLSLEATVIDSVMNRVQTYDPTQNMLLTLRGNKSLGELSWKRSSAAPPAQFLQESSHGALEIYLLQDLAISPPDCYQQLQRRRSEFELEPSTLGTNP